MTSPITDRLMPERCYLNYAYFTEKGAEPKFRKLPFFQNVSIQESRKPVYNIKGTPGSNEEAVTFSRTEARQIDLSFELSLNHFREQNTQYYIPVSDKESKEEQKKKFFDILPSNVNNNEVPYSQDFYDHYFGDDYVKQSYKDVLSYVKNLKYKKKQQTDKVIRQSIDDLFLDSDPSFGQQFFLEDGYISSRKLPPFQAVQAINPLFEALGLVPSLYSEQNLYINDEYIKVLDNFVYIINILRSGIMAAKSEVITNPTSEPPIILLNYGILYQNVPCICVDYNISFDVDTPYDLGTLLPHFIKVSLSLKENPAEAERRSGGFPFGTTVDTFERGYMSIVNEPFSPDLSPEVAVRR